MTTSVAATLTREELLDIQRRMCEIRVFEDIVKDWFSRALVRGSTHLYQGQEAVAVGVTSALRPGDTTTCTYRGHGTVLAQGAPLDRSFGEILGKANGLCHGKGGSMHLTDLSVGALGSFAIVGAHLPINVGAGWAAQVLGTGAVSASFFGDGATNIGTFHEALNLAGVWKLPVLFVIENNLYGEYSPISTTTANPNLTDRALAYGMPGVQVDGNDVVAVFEAAQAAVRRGRAGDGPTLLEAMTYRHSGHSRSDPGKYRPAGELEDWLTRDPLVVAEQRLRDLGVDQVQLAAIRETASATVREAADRALSWAEPAPEDRFENVWATR
ncbi:thiamine pyrophosphate-dependent dehydrogenase E1 component subunit alpha [Jatrophihabitans lederbergiae]|uniref:Thiamine pyrophosphate-dependent dehydrogenase E1 component subunit alpha n=1 Tax=Jatrophihabitans lederbergiae TaxID=3075547 RepID=A0ABU2JHM4_9ACTN|nr:thiamine pyrophosphate-dependent dehydrogenase E1 component subunit alpha [Jatrophihabitans sp. DSM 44399]MDT0264004.1 thiamine pyrophosphate-dependent dehydrogenase E1 component subunit alpha [Jatrophihabitans sp. DSM 44399]